MTLLQIDHINKVFTQGMQQIHALTDIQFSVSPGEFVALVGPSGSGKTTLLNLIGGLDTPTSGTITINDTQLTTLSDAALANFRLSQVGFIFQAYNLVPVLSAQENVELVMLLQGRAATERIERAAHYLSLVGLADIKHRRPNQMSGGQQQRVAVARALAAGPKLVLADEPTANLDSTNATTLLDIMYQLCQDEKTTFIFSTHDPRLMERAKRIITLEDGRITQDERFQ